MRYGGILTAQKSNTIIFLRHYTQFVLENLWPDPTADNRSDEESIPNSDTRLTGEAPHPALHCQLVIECVKGTSCC